MNGAILPLLFLIGVVALILICTVNVLAEAFPVVAVAVVLFCMVLLTVLCVAALKENGE